MRNLILLATTFAIALTEADVEQLGYEVEEADFLNYFGINKEAHTPAANFSPMDNSFFMTPEEEKEAHDKFMKNKAKKQGVAKKAADADKIAAADAKAETEAATKATTAKEEKEKAKAEAKAKREEAKAAKEAAAADKTPRAMGARRKIYCLVELGLTKDQIKGVVTDKPDSYINSKFKIASESPTTIKRTLAELKPEELELINKLVEEGKKLPEVSEATIKAQQEKEAADKAKAKAKAKKEADAKAKAEEEAKATPAPETEATPAPEAE